MFSSGKKKAAFPSKKNKSEKSFIEEEERNSSLKKDAEHYKEAYEKYLKSATGTRKFTLSLKDFIESQLNDKWSKNYSHNKFLSELEELEDKNKNVWEKADNIEKYILSNPGEKSEKKNPSNVGKTEKEEAPEKSFIEEVFEPAKDMRTAKPESYEQLRDKQQEIERINRTRGMLNINPQENITYEDFKNKMTMEGFLPSKGPLPPRGYVEGWEYYSPATKTYLPETQRPPEEQYGVPREFVDRFFDEVPEIFKNQEEHRNSHPEAYIQVPQKTSYSQNNANPSYYDSSEKISKPSILDSIMEEGRQLREQSALNKIEENLKNAEKMQKYNAFMQKEYGFIPDSTYVSPAERQPTSHLPAQVRTLEGTQIEQANQPPVSQPQFESAFFPSMQPQGEPAKISHDNLMSLLKGVSNNPQHIFQLVHDSPQLLNVSPYALHNILQGSSGPAYHAPARKRDIYENILKHFAPTAYSPEYQEEEEGYV